MPERVVLDTDVASLILRDQLASSVSRMLEPRTWCATFVTIGELWRWAEVGSWGPRRRRHLERWLASVTVLPYNVRVARIWGRISAAAAMRGRPRPINDTWIAAACMAHGLPLATLNTKDFAEYAEYDVLELAIHPR